MVDGTQVVDGFSKRNLKLGALTKVVDANRED
jgi:hypothetical protein